MFQNYTVLGIDLWNRWRAFGNSGNTRFAPACRVSKKQVHEMLTPLPTQSIK